MPTGPRNGFTEPHQSTLGGAEIFFMCAPGFVPAGRMRANCTSDGVAVDGIWTPDPATLMCNGEMIELEVSDYLIQQLHMYNPSLHASLD